MFALLLALLAAPDAVFENVHVVPLVEGIAVLRDHAVLVRDGRIAAVGRTVDAPEGTKRIDGRGRYLMPGLADMHVHLWYEEEFTLFLANGVTTVRNLWGRARHLRWARQVERGERDGPTLLTTGPILDGTPAIWEDSVVVRDPDEARRIVARLHERGFRSIKVYNRLRREVYDALVSACRARGMKVCGHVPYAVGIGRALAAGQDSIEHLDGYFGAVWRPLGAQARRDLARRTKEAGTWNCPTLVVYTRFVPSKEAKRFLAAPEMRFVPPRLRATWDPDRDFRLKDLPDSAFRRLERHIARQRLLVKALHDAGAPLLVGTDAGNPFVVAGWSVHLELAEFVKAGLSARDALVAATRAAGTFAGEPFGTVEPGRRADLLLVDGNPLEDVGRCRRPAGVMARGRWYAREKLDAMLEDVAESYERPKRRFRSLPELPEGRRFRWRVRWNGLVVGEERAALADDRLVAQSVNDAPWSSVRRTRLRLAADGSILAAKIAWRDDEIERERTYGPNEIDGDASFASWIATARRFRDLAVGEEWRGQHRRPPEKLREKGPETFPLVVRRLEDSEGRRCFSITMIRPDKAYKSRLQIDRDGVPTLLRTELQQGTVEIRRVD